eukprot:6876953-Ditylum_brightwellii.AAC.1
MTLLTSSPSGCIWTNLPPFSRYGTCRPGPSPMDCECRITADTDARPPEHDSSNRLVGSRQLYGSPERREAAEMKRLMVEYMFKRQSTS